MLAVYKQIVTKMKNNTIKSTTTKTAMKMAAGRMVEAATLPGAGAAIAAALTAPQIDRFVDDIIDEMIAAAQSATQVQLAAGQPNGNSGSGAAPGHGNGQGGGQGGQGGPVPVNSEPSPSDLTPAELRQLQEEAQKRSMTPTMP